MLKRFLTIAVVMVGGAFLATAQPRAAAVGRDVTVLGFKLHYLEAGRGAPVVLLHGLGGDGSRWGPNIEPLAKDFHVFALDQIGFGESDKPLANYHTGMLADDRLEKTIPGARKVIIDNCGHMPQLERADEFNRLIREFLLAAKATNQ